MLGELLTEERIQIAKDTVDWKEAIKLASKPLLDDGSITEEYVQAMIDAVEQFGPYMVLADRFALPHAQGSKGVKELSMSLLVVEEEVDMLGEPVNMFMVLASPDSSSHIDALASLSDLLTVPQNLTAIKTGSKETILTLVN
jgi:mannitol/fructose-specific phosphotransferase system IIA component (Ntr-type)